VIAFFWCAKSQKQLKCIDGIHRFAVASVATLLLWKRTRFYDKKNTRITKKTLD